MAIKQLAEVGNFKKLKLTILKDEFAKRVFSKSVNPQGEEIEYIGDNTQIFENYIYEYGEDLSYKLENSPYGTFVELFDFENGNIFGLYEDNSNEWLPPNMIKFKGQIKIKENEKLSNFTKSQASINAICYQTVNNIKYSFPFYLSIVYDDETQEAMLVAFECFELYSTSPIRWKTFLFPLIRHTNEFNEKETKIFYNLIKNIGVEYKKDPWNSAGFAGIGGGDGTFDFTSDNIALPDLPSIDAVSSGFLQLFTGGLSSILELSRYMWSTNFFDSIVKITANPIDIIMGLYMYPFIVPATTQKYVRAGNVITSISMGVPDSQILEIDCGELPIPNFYGAYLDYEPFTKCDLFLPYCGTFPLSMDDIAGKTINVRYRIDLLTGVCGAYVIVDGTVKYNYTGTCAINIPISSRSFENVYSAIMGVVGSMHGGSSFGLPSVGSIAGAVTSGKNQIQHGGNCSGNTGYLGVQKPYLIFSVPRVAIPKGLNKYTGYPIYATYKLADLKGYTEIEQIHLENMGQATQEEIDKIISMLEGGVIL